MTWSPGRSEFLLPIVDEKRSPSISAGIPRIPRIPRIPLEPPAILLIVLEFRGAPGLLFGVLVVLTRHWCHLLGL